MASAIVASTRETRDIDLSEYLNSDLFLESPEPQDRISAKSGILSESKLLTPATPELLKRSEKYTSDIIKMVMEVFDGARRTTREEYQRLAGYRDRKGRKKYGRN